MLLQLFCKYLIPHLVQVSLRQTALVITQQRPRLCPGALPQSHASEDSGSGKVLGFRKKRTGTKLKNYLFTLKRISPFSKKSTICLAAAIPALLLASEVWAPIFLGVKKKRFR